MTTKPSGSPERVFHIGRNASSILMVCFGLLWLCVGLLPLLSPNREPGSAYSIGPIALALVVFILGGGAVAGGYLLVFFREALAIHPEGLLRTDWRARQTFIAWSELEGLVTGPPTLYVSTSASLWSPAGNWTLYLVVRQALGDSRRVEAGRIGPRRAYDEITSAIAAHADLEYVGDAPLGLNPGEKAWRRKSAAAETRPLGDGPPPVAPAADGDREAQDAIMPPQPQAPAPGAGYPVAIAHGAPERVFHTGRTSAISFFSYFGVLFALFGAAFLFVLYAGQGEQEPSLSRITQISGPMLVAWAMVIGGIVASVIFLLSYIQGALMVYVEGLVFRDWLGRRRYVPWPEVEGLVVRSKLSAPSGTRVGVATPSLVLFLVVRGAEGQSRRIKVAQAFEWQPLYREITSNLAKGANLEYAGKHDGEDVWRKRPA